MVYFTFIWWGPIDWEACPAHLTVGATMLLALWFTFFSLQAEGTCIFFFCVSVYFSIKPQLPVIIVCDGS